MKIPLIIKSFIKIVIPTKNLKFFTITKSLFKKKHLLFLNNRLHFLEKTVAININFFSTINLN